MQLRIARWDTVWPVQSWQVHLQSKSNSQGRAQAKKAWTLLQRVRLVRKTSGVRVLPRRQQAILGSDPRETTPPPSSKGSEGPNILKHTCSWRGNQVQRSASATGLAESSWRFSGQEYTSPFTADCLQWDVEHLRGLVLQGGLSKLEELFWNSSPFPTKIAETFSFVVNCWTLFRMVCGTWKLSFMLRDTSNSCETNLATLPGRFRKIVPAPQVTDMQWKRTWISWCR